MDKITSCSIILTPTEEYSGAQRKATWSYGPFLQGALMELASPAFAEYVHQCPFNPYSQYCVGKDDGILRWTIHALNDEAAENLIVPLLTTPEITLTRPGKTFVLALDSLQTKSYEDLTSLIYETPSGGGPASRLGLSFLTPTAFKSQGEYIFLPTIRLLLQNAYMRYSMLCTHDKEIDEDTLEYLANRTKISQYRLRSASYAHVTNTGKNISGFVGDMTLALNGPATAQGLAKMLFTFAQYSGMGIKTSMGMGGFTCELQQSQTRKEELGG